MGKHLMGLYGGGVSIDFSRNDGAENLLKVNVSVTQLQSGVLLPAEGSLHMDLADAKDLRDTLEGWIREQSR